MSRRKPALRIGGGVVNRHTLYEKDSGKPGGLGLLGAYNDTSDTDENIDNTDPAKTGNNLDSKVADFLKEIDELDSESKESKTSTENPPTTVLWGDWQQCIDQNTQHPYYWNTKTNEVTWILPQEIAVQIQAQNPGETKSKTKTEESKTEEDERVKGKTKIKDLKKAESEVPTQEKKKLLVQESKEICSSADLSDIDVDAELEQALQVNKEKPNIPPASVLDLELELLHRGILPLSNSEEEQLLEGFEAEILKLEENEEKIRATGQWKNYEKEIEKKNEEIRCNKMKWRSERLPTLKKLIPEKAIDSDKKEESNAIFNEPVPDDPKKTKENDQKTDDITAETSSIDKEDNPEEEETTSRSGEQAATVVDDSQCNSNLVHTGVQCDIQTKSNQETEPCSNEETDVKVKCISTEILDKLTFLEISKKTMTDFHILLIEIQTRMTDWKDKALSSSHLLKKLQEASERLQHYEDTATPDNWSCHWDSSAKRYFYMNKESGKMQWEYPDVVTGSSRDVDKNVADEEKPENGSEKKAKEKKLKKRKIESIKKSEMDQKRSRSLSPVSTRDLVKPKSDQAPKQEKNEIKKVKTESSSATETFSYSNQYPYASYQNYGAYSGYHMMMGGQQMAYPTNDSTPPPPPGEEPADVAPPPLPTEQPPPPPSSPPLPPSEEVEGEGGDKATEDDDGIVMEMSDGEAGEDEPDKNPTAVMSQQPVLYKPTSVAQSFAMHPMMAANQYYSSVQMSTVPVNQANSTKTHISESAKMVKTSKSKTSKKVKKSTSAKKPPKEMSSLVAQWQKAKQQIEEENRMLEEDEEEEDPAEVAKKQIEKWKQDQILSGKALSNANFEPVPADWRTRILKKKAKN